MSLIGLAWRFLWARPLVTVLTLLGVMLGAALISGVLTVRAESERATLGQEPLHDIVVGAKGSPLQLILAAVQHIDVPPGNIPYSRFEALRDDSRVRSAVPIGLGDNYQGFRIVGTTPEYFGQAPRAGRDDTSPPPSPYRIAQGRHFEDTFEAVIGARVAAETGLTIGSTFAGSHGITAVGGEVHDDFPYEVVGILAPMGGPDDRAIFSTLESVWQVHESDVEMHEERARQRREARAAARAEAGEEPEPERRPGSFLAGFAAPPQAEREREVTAVLIQLESPGLRVLMQREINDTTEAMAAVPITEMLRLYQRVVGPVHQALLIIAWVVVAVASLSVLATLYQSAERRRREIAILRAMGARPGEMFLLVLLEALFLATLGVVAGWLLGHGGAALAGGYLESRLGIVLSPWSTTLPELLALAVVWLVGVAAGLIPAATAYFRSPAADLSAS